MHPLLHLLIKQPGLLGEHALGYAELLGSELAAFKQAGQRRLVWGAASVGLALVGSLLGGVALMLWAALPAMPPATAWVLLATPAVPLVAALGCWLRLRSLSHSAAFATLQEQFKADMQLFHEVSAP
jgi:uncharacterized membrane protein YqjE